MKKTFKFLSASAVAFAFALSAAFALPSQTANGAVVGEPTIDGKPVEGMKVQFENAVTTAPVEQKDNITAINSGKSLSETLTGETVKTPANFDLAKANVLTEVQDLVARDADGNVLKDVKNITVTWEVPNLTQGIGDVHVLHFSTVRNVWEVLTPSKVDYENKTLTTTFPDLSPVAVIYTPSNAVDKGDNVDTGDHTNVMLYAGLAVVALAAMGTIAFRTKKHS